MYINETLQTHSTNNTKHRKYEYTYYRITHIIVETTPHTLTHTLQNKLKQPRYKLKQSQYKLHTKWNSHDTINYPQ
jgi:hypothetical protein